MTVGVLSNKVLRTSSRWDGAVAHLGYESVDDLSAPMTDTQLVAKSQEALREVKAVADTDLTPRQLASLKLARGIADTFKWAPIRGVYGALIPPASARTRTAGLYGVSTQEIFIALDQLESGRNTIDTLVHEIAHHTAHESGLPYEDGDKGHYEEISKVAAQVVQHTGAGDFDTFFKADEFRWG